MPGVPPDAIDNLKKVFKGMFKRGKKTKQDESTYYQQQNAYPPPPPGPPPQSAIGSQSAAPQIPPVESHAPLQNTPDTSKPLPPTHPLATGKHSEPQEAVPQNGDARPGPPAPAVGPAAASDGGYAVKDEEKTSAGDVSPLPGSTANDENEPVSAIESDRSPQAPPKTDSGIGEPKAEDQAVTDSQAAVTKENTQPNGTLTEDKPSTNDAPATEQQTTVNQTDANTQSEEKVPATMEEPPPIKAVSAAPGMSATSGPLDDFPEGGFTRDESPTRA